MSATRSCIIGGVQSLVRVRVGEGHSEGGTACHQIHSHRSTNHLRAFHHTDRSVRLSVQICRDSLTTDVRLNVPPDRTSPHPSLRQRRPPNGHQDRRGFISELVVGGLEVGKRGHSLTLVSSNQYLLSPAYAYDDGYVAEYHNFAS